MSGFFLFIVIPARGVVVARHDSLLSSCLFLFLVGDKSMRRSLGAGAEEDIVPGGHGAALVPPEIGRAHV